MALITVNDDKFRMVARVLQLDKCSSKHLDKILSEFKEVFEDELSQLPSEVHLEVNPSIAPHVAVAQRIPVAINGELKAELKRQVGKKMIAPVHEPKSWVSAFTLMVKKNEKLQVCID